ncbi:hypothetical protein [Pseudomonas aeruginosa]|uniref:hypothetical protein n=1 Tax=Pseudomonas aeruginosa TaxID=287 RepID=UPI000DFCB579|nr:hypothetical protein [Pseudomonas aeruginosa]
MSNEAYKEWPFSLREVHLIGGIRAYNHGNNKVEIHPATTNAKNAIIKINKYENLYSDLEKFGLPVVGCDFFTTRDEADGIHPPQWRTNCQARNRWLATEQGFSWSFIANSAFKDKNALVCDIALRISHQIKTCEWRIRQLSECYLDQLSSRIKSVDSFTDCARFKNGYTSFCYLALQSFLIDGCILRDYLSEFYWVCAQNKESAENEKITTLSGLLKFWKKSPPNTPAGLELKNASKKGQWLYEMGAYRDLIVHTAPLASAGKTLLAVNRLIYVNKGREALPAIKLPIPNSPSQLTCERTKGKYFQDTNLDFARFKNFIEDTDSCRDSLEYACFCMNKLSELSLSIASISPLGPQIPIITPIPGTLKVIEED